MHRLTCLLLLVVAVSYGKYCSSPSEGHVTWMRNHVKWRNKMIKWMRIIENQCNPGEHWSSAFPCLNYTKISCTNASKLQEQYDLSSCTIFSCADGSYSDNDVLHDLWQKSTDVHDAILSLYEEVSKKCLTRNCPNQLSGDETTYMPSQTTLDQRTVPTTAISDNTAEISTATVLADPSTTTATRTTILGIITTTRRMPVDTSATTKIATVVPTTNNGDCTGFTDGGRCYTVIIKSGRVVDYYEGTRLCVEEEAAELGNIYTLSQFNKLRDHVFEKQAESSHVLIWTNMTREIPSGEIRLANGESPSYDGTGNLRSAVEWRTDDARRTHIYVYFRTDGVVEANNPPGYGNVWPTFAWNAALCERDI